MPHRRGAAPASAIERIRSDHVNPDIGMVGLEGLKQAQGELFFGGILRVRCSFAVAVFGGTPCFLRLLSVLYHALISGQADRRPRPRACEILGSPRRETRGFVPRDSRHFLCRVVYTDRRASSLISSAGCGCSSMTRLPEVRPWCRRMTRTLATRRWSGASAVSKHPRQGRHGDHECPGWRVRTPDR